MFSGAMLPCFQIPRLKFHVSTCDCLCPQCSHIPLLPVISVHQGPLLSTYYPELAKFCHLSAVVSLSTWDRIRVIPVCQKAIKPTICIYSRLPPTTRHLVHYIPTTLTKAHPPPPTSQAFMSPLTHTCNIQVPH